MLSAEISDDSRAAAWKPARHPWLWRQRWFVLFVILPTLLVTLYYGLIASDQYISESRFVIRSQAQRPGQVSTVANLIQTAGPSAGQEQTNEVLDYLRSRAALSELQAQVDVHRLYSTRGADWLSRYPRPFSDDLFENLYKFYGRMIDARMEKETGVAVLEVRAFTPKDAHDINQALLDQSEKLVNRLNDRAAQKAISEAERRVTLAEGRVRAARVMLGDYRNAQQLLDPAKQATGVLDVTTRLVSEQAALQAQLDLTRRLAPENPSIPALESRVRAIGAQVGAQTGRAVGTSNGIASKLGNYESLAAEQEFAQKNLDAASAALEVARAEAVKQQFYLERVVEPNTPDMSLYPHRVWQILTIAAALVCLYFIGWMLVVGILEHAPED